MKPYIFPSSIETARALILHLVKLMLDEPDRTFCIAFSGGSTPALMLTYGRMNIRISLLGND